MNPKIVGYVDRASVSFKKIGEPLQLPKGEVIMRYSLCMELVIMSGYSCSF